MADIPLEPMGGAVRFGTKGPDKWAFIHDGILDRKYDGTDHEFVIEDRKIHISISGGRQIPAWQCPSHPGINPQYHDHEWAEAWHFNGCGDGCLVEGIYSTRSRKGVYHFWPIAFAGHKDCTACRQDLRYFFAGRDSNSAAMLALIRAMKHMARGTAVGGYHVDCAECWELFRQLRQSCELP